MLLLRNDGKQVTATWKPQIMGFDVPQLMADGKVVRLIEPLRWYQWAWSGLPVLMVFAGGALGAFFSLVAFSINAKIFRSGLINVMKYVAAGGISLLSFMAYLILATIVSLFLSG